MIKDGKLVRVVLPYATYGLIVKDGIIVDAPPIARWLIGKTTAFARLWIRDKRGAASLLDKDTNV